MDKQPIADDETELPPAMQAAVDQVRQAAAAIEIANAADPIELNIDGEVVRSLEVTLSAIETERVMSLPVDLRAKMAEDILKERSIAMRVRALAVSMRDAKKRERHVTKVRAKAKRKAAAKARRKNR